MDGAAGTTVRSTIDAPRALVCVTGDLDIDAVPALVAALHEVLEARATEVVVDLSGAGFVGAAALGVLCAARERLARTGGSLVLGSWSPGFRRVCAAAGLGEVFGLAA